MEELWGRVAGSPAVVTLRGRSHIIIFHLTAGHPVLCVESKMMYTLLVRDRGRTPDGAGRAPIALKTQFAL